MIKYAFETKLSGLTGLKFVANQDNKTVCSATEEDPY